MQKCILRWLVSVSTSTFSNNPFDDTLPVMDHSDHKINLSKDQNEHTWSLKHETTISPTFFGYKMQCVAEPGWHEWNVYLCVSDKKLYSLVYLCCSWASILSHVSRMYANPHSFIGWCIPTSLLVSTFLCTVTACTRPIQIVSQSKIVTIN